VLKKKLAKSLNQSYSPLAEKKKHKVTNEVEIYEETKESNSKTKPKPKKKDHEEKNKQRAIRRVLSSEPSRQNDVFRKTPKTNKD